MSLLTANFKISIIVILNKLVSEELDDRHMKQKQYANFYRVKLPDSDKTRITTFIF